MAPLSSLPARSQSCRNLVIVLLFQIFNQTREGCCKSLGAPSPDKQTDSPPGLPPTRPFAPWPPQDTSKVVVKIGAGGLDGIPEVQSCTSLGLMEAPSDWSPCLPSPCGITKPTDVARWIRSSFFSSIVVD